MAPKDFGCRLFLALRLRVPGGKLYQGMKHLIVDEVHVFRAEVRTPSAILKSPVTDWQAPQKGATSRYTGTAREVHPGSIDYPSAELERELANARIGWE
ncbi:hypothetical protein BC628DRAFT_1417949 [Trametes gibbosa]|nr:hypothetical protein BC628DRAFT_1417949 [Trametes gibbosa]